MDFLHQPLADAASEIRLLSFIQSPEETSDLRLHVTTWILEHAPKYTAISYHWGDGDLRALQIDEKPFLVTPNCLEALTQVRSHCANDYLWIDSICINQKDAAEKSKQVGMMWEIFQKATKVCACVGPNADDSEVLIDLIGKTNPATCQNLDEWLSRQQDDHQLDWVCHTIKSLGYRPYWERLWIVPEIGAAMQKPRECFKILSGKDQIDWSSLTGFLDLLATATRAARSDTPRWRQLSRSTMTSFGELSRRLSYRRWTLNNAFIGFSHFKCAVPHDHLYALLPLVDEADLGIPMPEIKPDYTLSSLELALSVAHFVAPAGLPSLLTAFGVSQDKDSVSRAFSYIRHTKDTRGDFLHATRLLIPLTPSAKGSSGPSFSIIGRVLKNGELYGLRNGMSIRIATEMSRLIIPWILIEGTWQMLQGNKGQLPVGPYAINAGQMEPGGLSIAVFTDCLGVPSHDVLLELRRVSNGFFEIGSIGVFFGGHLPELRAEEFSQAEIQLKEQANDRTIQFEEYRPVTIFSQFQDGKTICARSLSMRTSWTTREDVLSEVSLMAYEQYDNPVPRFLLTIHLRIEHGERPTSCRADTFDVTHVDDTARRIATTTVMEAHSPNQGRKYKSRKERPCDACRRRKVCCIREPGDEACSLCRMQNTSCRYDKGPTPRRRRPPSGTIPVYPMYSDGESATPLPASVPTPRDSVHDAPLIPHATGGEWIGQYVGLSGDQDPFVLRHCNFTRSNYYKSDEWACLRVGNDGIMPSHFTLVPDSHLDARPPHYPPSSLLDDAYPLHHELLSTYFEVVHTSFPLLDPARFTKGNKIDLPLLATMYSLALPFCPAAKEVSYVAINSFLFQALPLEARTPRLDTIEAGLLFLQRHTQIHRAPTTPGLYAEIGSLVGMCHDAGLNVDPSSWDLTASDKSRRKRLWWAMLISDKWAALGLGRPSYIHEADCNVPLPCVEDIPAETVGKEFLPATSAQMFVAIAALSQILSSVLTTFYTLKGAEHLAHSNSEEIARMKEYFEALLTEFHAEYILPLSNVVDVFLDPTGTLFLAFYTVQIVLYRALLRGLSSIDPLCQQIRLQSRAVISQISKLLENLQVTRLRAFWWSPISRINFAMAGGFMFSMLLSSVTDDEIEYWSAEISRYRRLLDMQSLAFDTTKLAAARMSALANVSSGGRPASAGAGRVDPKQAFCRDFGVELNTL